MIGFEEDRLQFDSAIAATILSIAVRSAGSGGTVIGTHDREGDRLSAGGNQIAAQSACFSQSARFGEDFAVEQGLLEAGGEGAVDAADGKRGAECLAPTLPCSVDEQGGKGPGSYQVLRGKPAAVKKTKSPGSTPAVTRNWRTTRVPSTRDPSELSSLPSVLRVISA